MNIIDKTGRVVDSAASFPEAIRVIDAMDRNYTAQGPHTIQNETVKPTVQPTKKRRFSFFGRAA